MKHAIGLVSRRTSGHSGNEDISQRRRARHVDGRVCYRPDSGHVFEKIYQLPCIRVQFVSAEFYKGRAEEGRPCFAYLPPAAGVPSRSDDECGEKSQSYHPHSGFA
jgi:hypothetical protein